MTAAITRLERCAAADEQMATLTRDEARLLLTLWVAANETVAFHAPKAKSDDEVSKPHRRLRNAIRGLSS